MEPKFPHGPPNPHILSSEGPTQDNLHFYCTTYSNVYKGDNGEANRKPHYSLRHKGTGYVSNFRPAIYYSPKQDAVDNPPMRKLLEDSYDSCTKKGFVRPPVPDPNDPLPTKVVPGLSGFAQNEHTTLPTQREVREVHVDTRLGSSLPIYPRHREHLYHLSHRDPIPRENAGHGPRSMSTESNVHFVKKKLLKNSGKPSSHARIEDTGFTQAVNIEPLTFRPHENYSGELPGYMTWRPTGKSITKKDFLTTPYLKGDEPLGNLTSRADLSNGYIKGNSAQSGVQPSAADMVGYTKLSQLHPTVQQRVKQNDPAEHTILSVPYQYTTLKGMDYQGTQRPPLSEDRRLGRECVGPKESTGFTSNTLPLVEPSKAERDAGRFSTHYNSRFVDSTLKGVAREGYLATGGGVMPPVDDAYAKSTRLHKLGSPVDTARELRTMHPYTARSLTKRYPYHNDHTHSHKTRSLIGTM